MDLTKLGVLETAKLIHEKKVSCEEVVKAYLKTLKQESLLMLLLKCLKML